MTAPSRSDGTFTGRHMAMIIVAFFAVVVGVNVTMATLARWSWSGLVVRNTYVASQEFNGKVAAAREQAALGWSARLDLADGRVEVALVDAGGRAVPLESARLNLRSPATDREDSSVALTRDGDAFAGKLSLRDGAWVAEIVATAAGGREWHDTRRILIQGGRLK